MDANGSATTHISHCTVYNTIHHVTYASETKITSTATAREETKIMSTIAPEETIEEIPHTNSTESKAKRAIEYYYNRLASMPISHREVSSELSFQESYNMLLKDVIRLRRPAIWQESGRISQMQIHSEHFTSVPALVAAPHSRQMVPLVDWRLLQGSIGHWEQMEHYAKRDPVFVASLSFEAGSDDLDLDWMLSWLSEMVINVQKLCTQPMLLLTLNGEMSYTDHCCSHNSCRIDISIIETGYTTRIPRYQALHDPTRARPHTVPPTLSIPASTAKSSSSNNPPLVLAPKTTSPPKYGPRPPPPVLPCPNTNQGVSRVIPTRVQPSAIPIRVVEAPVTKRTIPKLTSKPSYIPRPYSPLRSTGAVRLSKKELTVTGQIEQLSDTVKSQNALLEKQNLMLEKHNLMFKKQNLVLERLIERLG
ncbi:hypothetical protein BDN72DRAFT_880039 [Pluteus cervinus]|uniref:Uncharacterized protein n=1 Tax=Pluteus cervinus TaxID=181527 RepID=A0ACD3ANA8_9AGAR|nr:hypothetical protein BDN72DRAFT_880039 [Pluteus cervinus]